MSFKIIGKEENDPVLLLALENDLVMTVPVNDVAETGRHRLGKILEVEINRIIREATLAERDRIQEGIKHLLGINATGRQG